MFRPMEHLIELLNEYEKTRDYYKVHTYIMYKDDEWIEVDDKRTDLEIISKEYWFIQWLVENDKIDTDELLGIYWETRQSIWEDNKYELYSEYKRLLMLLSIQDNPIEFLCSILK